MKDVPRLMDARVKEFSVMSGLSYLRNSQYTHLSKGDHD